MAPKAQRCVDVPAELGGDTRTAGHDDGRSAGRPSHTDSTRSAGRQRLRPAVRPAVPADATARPAPAPRGRRVRRAQARGERLGSARCTSRDSACAASSGWLIQRAVRPPTTASLDPHDGQRHLQRPHDRPQPHAVVGAPVPERVRGQEVAKRLREARPCVGHPPGVDHVEPIRRRRRHDARRHRGADSS